MRVKFSWGSMPSDPPERCCLLCFFRPGYGLGSDCTSDILVLCHAPPDKAALKDMFSCYIVVEDPPKCMPLLLRSLVSPHYQALVSSHDVNSIGMVREFTWPLHMCITDHTASCDIVAMVSWFHAFITLWGGWVLTESARLSHRTAIHILWRGPPNTYLHFNIQHPHPPACQVWCPLPMALPPCLPPTHLLFKSLTTKDLLPCLILVTGYNHPRNLSLLIEPKCKHTSPPPRKFKV